MARDYEDEVDNEDWVDDDDESALLHCPSCREEVHEDTQKCPFCGEWIIPQDLSGERRRLIWIVAVILLIVSMTLVALW